MKIEVKTPARIRFMRPVVHFIKEWRKHRDLSLEKLGEMAGVSPSMISQLERGKTTYTQTTLEALARALEVEPWQLLACGDPGVETKLWRIIASLDQSDMKAVLREYAERRGKEFALNDLHSSHDT